MTLDDIFGATGNATWTQECARAVVIFVYGWVLVRLPGRRVFGQWSALDVIVAIVTGSTLSRALTGNANLFGTIAAVSLLMALHWLLAGACARWQGASRVLEGSAVVLGRDGNTDSATLAQYGISPAVLDEALRRRGVDSAARTTLILLEPSGQITVLVGR